MARTKASVRGGAGKSSKARDNSDSTSNNSALKKAKQLQQQKKQIKAKAKAKAKAKRAQHRRFEQDARRADVDANDNDNDNDDDEEEEEEEGFIELASETKPTTGKGNKRARNQESPSRRRQGEGQQDEEEEPEGDPQDHQQRLQQQRKGHECMPWMGNRKSYPNKNLYLCLHEEILDFVRFVSPLPNEIEAREQLVVEMKQLVHKLWDKAQVETFGSHETQMFLPQSDIDMLVLNAPKGLEPLYELRDQLEALEMTTYLEVIDKARIPIVKFIHKQSGIQVDMCFNVTSGLATADMVKHYMRLYPSFRPLVLVLKYFLAQRQLNETYAGGVGSFLLQIMVVSFLQHHRRQLVAKGYDYDEVAFNNLGQLLVGFLTLYGHDLFYQDVGISLHNGGEYFLKTSRDDWFDPSRPYLLSVENPNEPSVDIGKNSYEIRNVRRAFDFARMALASEIYRRGQTQKPLPGSILGSILVADSFLLARPGPSQFGFEILHHDPTKTAEAQRRYEARRDEELRKKQQEEEQKNGSNQGNGSLKSKRKRTRGGDQDAFDATPSYRRWTNKKFKGF